MSDAHGLALARATPDDLAFIMATERLPGYDALVGRWDAQRHVAAMEDGRHAYFVARLAGVAVGFAILRDWDSPERVTLVKRIAIARPGQGLGTKVVRELVAKVFLETKAHRLWIGVFPDNVRARRAYETAGFTAEGIARGSAYFGGIFRDELILAILRPDWDARRQA